MYEIDSILELLCVNAHFLKRCQKCVDEGQLLSPVIRYVITFLCNFTHLYAIVQRGIAFDLQAGTWAITGCHRQPVC